MLTLLHLSTLFPYTTLFRSEFQPFSIFCEPNKVVEDSVNSARAHSNRCSISDDGYKVIGAEDFIHHLSHMMQIDRKSTRLNSSHVRISYAVFCLKKKNL